MTTSTTTGDRARALRRLARDSRSIAASAERKLQAIVADVRQVEAEAIAVAPSRTALERDGARGR
ncbi:MAG: hypothetical protein IH936_11495 [Acidobacteria bacterium]|nr:hypothetical protein [Acidobacteriota bacterium]